MWVNAGRDQSGSLQLFAPAFGPARALDQFSESRLGPREYDRMAEELRTLLQTRDEPALLSWQLS